MSCISILEITEGVLLSIFLVARYKYKKYKENKMNNRFLNKDNI